MFPRCQVLVNSPLVADASFGNAIIMNDLEAQLTHQGPGSNYDKEHIHHHE